MLQSEYDTNRQALVDEMRRRVSELNKERLAARLYPDGFIVSRKVPFRGEWVDATCRIAKATLAGGTAWDSTQFDCDILYHLEVITPEDYDEGESPYAKIPEGKYAYVKEAHLLKGSADLVPIHPI